MSNHVIVGLGRTGGKIIRAFRRITYQALPENIDTPEGISLGYLYVDASDEMMVPDDPAWKLLGHSLQLPPASQVLLDPDLLKERLNRNDNASAFQPWIGSTEQVPDVLNTTARTERRVQSRRLGRLLFACSIDAFLDALHGQVRDVKARSQASRSDVTFHILCGLAGSTGSGCLLDVITQIRAAYPPEAPTSRHSILVYAMLPESRPKPHEDTGPYHANGYAALLELNALSTGHYHPHDLAASSTEIDSPADRGAARMPLADPFTICYLVTNENESGLTVDVEDELPALVADFLYHTIVVGQDGSGEEDENTPEEDNQDTESTHSTRFRTFGIKRLAYPESVIRSYLTHSYAGHVGLQLRYNHWSDEAGYLNSPKDQDVTNPLNPEQLRRWSLSNSHLTLSEAILPQDRANERWKTIPEEWQTVLPRFVSVVKQMQKKRWLDELGTLCQRRFEEDYRGTGVPTFYMQKIEAKEDIAREISKQIESDLLDAWTYGDYSMEAVSALIAASITTLDDKYTNIEGKISALQGIHDAQRETLEAIQAAWQKIGPVAALLHKRERLLSRLAPCLETLYTCRTQIEAWKFAKHLLPAIIDELQRLKANVEVCAGVVNQAAEHLIQHAETRLQAIDLDAQAVSHDHTRFYDPEGVRATTKRWLLNKDEQEDQTAEARRTLIASLGDQPTFVRLNDQVSSKTLIDRIVEHSARRTDRAHEILIDNPEEKFLNVSVIDRLRDRHAAHPDDLKQFAANLVDAAGYYLAFDPAEMEKTGTGSSYTLPLPSCVRLISILSNKPTEAFEQGLYAALQASISGTLHVTTSTAYPNALALIKTTGPFPLRFVRQIRFLKEKYEDCMHTYPEESIRRALHTDGDGTQFPSLYLLTQAEQDQVAEQKHAAAISSLLLAKALGLIQEIEHFETGRKQWALLHKDSHGLDADPMYLGHSLATSIDEVKAEQLQIIRQEVHRLLNKEYNRKENRKALIPRIIQEIESVKTERNNDINDPVYRRFLSGGRTVIMMLERER